MEAGYRILEHPADLGLEAWGETLSDAFRQSVLALISVIVDPSAVNRVTRRPVDIQASDPEQLLVRLLSEVLFCIDAERFITTQLVIDEMKGTALKGALIGESLDPAKHVFKLDVKAITYHQLSITENGGIVRAKVFVDI
ncbi:MAG: archease [Bacteroidota bacterium]